MRKKTAKTLILSTAQSKEEKMKTTTKNHLIALLHEKLTAEGLNLTRAQTAKVVNGLLSLIAELLLSGQTQEIKLRGFGTFRAKTIGYNIKPPQGQQVKGQTLTITFKAGKRLKKRL